MDFEDTTDAAEVESLPSLEFNNQASLKQQEINDSKDKIHEQKNSWHEDNEPAQTSVSSFAIPLPPPPSQSPSVGWLPETDPDFARPDLGDDLEALFSSSDTRSDHLGDLIDVGAEAGVCGLRNLGNTCFMSTGVQCLVATPALVHCLLHQPPPQLPSDSLTSHLSLLTHKMWSGQYSAVQPSDFKEMLGTHYPQFKDFRQHDCQEFLALLLDGLHEQMNSSSLHNKLHKMFDADCDVENHSKMCSKQVPNGLCINTSPNHNNLKENNDSINKAVNKCETETPKMDKKINNCEVNDNNSADASPKLPLVLNKYKNGPETSVKTDQLLSVHNRTKDSLPSNVLNNCSPRLNGFEDIIKDAKTSNVNVLVTEQEANNEIKFDSDKFPKSENVRRRETFNFNSFHLYENNMTSGKRGKSTVTHYKSTVDFREGLDLKRLKMQRNEQTQDESDSDTIMDCDWEKNHRMEDELRHRVSSKNLDKNYRMECERKRRDDPGPSSASEATEAAQTEVDLDAEVHWQKHLAAHKSVIVDTFQGQFKSTVVCSTCKHVSVTYEPFMYLSVPLPHAMERQLSVTFVAARETEPVQYMVTVSKRDTVANIKEQLLHLIGRPVSLMVLAEVLDYHIAKILDENHLVRYINSTNRDLYAVELANFSQFAGLDPPVDIEKMVGCEPLVCDLTGDACTICLEEKDSNMSRHVGCSCILCDSCIVRSSQHYGDESLKCPVCRKELTPGENLVTIGLTPDTKPPVRMLNVPLVFRLDTLGDGNNMRTVQLFGHPRLLRLPNQLECQQLHEAVASLMPYSSQYKILLVDGQGHHCSRCMFNAHCRGCPVDTEGSLVLRAGDCLAAMFSEPVPEISAVPHTTMLQSVVNSTITLYDCIQAFSQSEVLDEHNPWFCPNCKKNQCATKTLSVWRYPNYLIIYLKRFVFQDCVSTKLDDKVTFPLQGLSLLPNSSLYDLYACVCHIGGVSAGHYTAYTKHPRTGEWHHYNDDCVTKQPPQEEDFSNAYILFYRKRGADIKNEDFNAKLGSLNSENFS